MRTRPTSHTDEYQRSAEYIDIMLAEPWAGIAPLVAAGLAGYDAGAGPIVDVGAGTGRGVLALAEAFPDAEIVAVEPSDTMRAVLMARAGGSEDLRRRVTVVPGDLMTAPLPARFGGVVAMNMLGHLDAAARARFWSVLAERLAPGASAVVNLQRPAEAVAVPEATLAEVSVGRRTYLGSGSAEPAGPGQVVWHMRYRAVADGVTVADERVDYAWWIVSEATLRGETAAAGLSATPLTPLDAMTYVLRPAPPE